MRKKEIWMKKGAIVRALGKLGTIVKMEENSINGVDYVYYITVKLSGETRKRKYHPNDITPRIMIMERKSLTWKELADRINKMSDGQKNELVRVWGEDRPLSDGVWLDVENEDMCYDPDCPEDGCEVRSNWEERDQLIVALPAGKYYLTAI